MAIEPAYRTDLALIHDVGNAVLARHPSQVVE
jgi:hypothetical protein